MKSATGRSVEYSVLPSSANLRDNALMRVQCSGSVVDRAGQAQPPTPRITERIHRLRDGQDQIRQCQGHGRHVRGRARFDAVVDGRHQPLQFGTFVNRLVPLIGFWMFERKNVLLTVSLRNAFSALRPSNSRMPPIIAFSSDRNTCSLRAAMFGRFWPFHLVRSAVAKHTISFRSLPLAASVRSSAGGAALHRLLSSDPRAPLRQCLRSRWVMLVEMLELESGV